MFSIAELRSEHSENVKRMDELANLSATESRVLTEEEQGEFDKLEKRNEEIKKIIEQLEKVEKEKSYLSERANERPNIQVVREENCNEDGEYRGYSHVGEFLSDVARAENPAYHGMPKKLQELRAATGAGENIGQDGGFLVQSDFAVEIFNQVVAADQLASQCRKVPISSQSNALTLTLLDQTSRATGSRWGGVRGYWRGEGDTVTATKPKLRQERLALESLMAIFYATDELLEDSTALGALATEAFTEELSWLLGDAILHGDGAAKPQGIVGHASSISIAKESGQTADTVVYNNVDKMVDRMALRSKPGAKWYIHPDVKRQLRNMYTTPGTLTDFMPFMPAGGISGAPYDTLFGKEIVEIEQAKALGDLGDIILADLSQYLLITKGGIEAAQSMHVRFLYNEMTYRWNMRVNGQPLWNSALTDAYGSTTRSPFITLAERA